MRIKESLQQLHLIANGSLPMIIFCLCFASAVTILESSFHMRIVVQNDSLVPGFASVMILRELGAVVTALLLTARIGAGIAAEVGTMKVTEQIDALRMLGIDPINYLLVPRLIAGVIGMALLCTIAIMTCIFSAMIVSDTYLGYPPALFLSSLKAFVHFKDLLFAIIKAAVFGAVIPLVSCYFGFTCQAGADGVGKATTRAVVTSSIAIILLDFVLSYTFSYFY